MHSNIRNQAIAAREIVFDAFERLDDLLDDMSAIESTVRKWCPLLDNGLGLKKVIGRDFAEIDDDLFARRLSEARSEIVAMRDERMAEIDELLFGIRTRSDDASNKSFKMIDEMEFSWIELNFIDFGERSYQYAVEAACNVSRDALPKWVSSFFSDHFIKHVPQTKQEVDSLRLNAKYFFETCPFTKSIEEALRKRKMIEMARLIRDIPNAIEAGYWEIDSDETLQNPSTGFSVPNSTIETIVERFRFAANEFRDTRQLPYGRLSEIASRQIMEMNYLTQHTWVCGGLRSVPELFQFAPNDFSQYGTGVENPRGEFMFRALAGYCDLKAGVNFSDQYFLEPGLLAPFSSVFQVIHVSGKSKFDIEDIELARQENSFEILGYYALACNVIADILEREQLEAPSKNLDSGAEPNAAKTVGNIPVSIETGSWQWRDPPTKNTQDKNSGSKSPDKQIAAGGDPHANKKGDKFGPWSDWEDKANIVRKLNAGVWKTLKRNSGKGDFEIEVHKSHPRKARYRKKIVDKLDNES